MKAHEFRKGNLISQGDYGIIPLTAYEIYQLELKEKGSTVAEYYSQFQCVAITEKWFENFGLIKNNNSQGKYCLTDGVYINLKGEVFYEYWEEKSGFSSLVKKVICVIKHIHQLQNIYYSLTGAELTVKELA